MKKIRPLIIYVPGTPKVIYHFSKKIHLSVVSMKTIVSISSFMKLASLLRVNEGERYMAN